MVKRISFTREELDDIVSLYLKQNLTLKAIGEKYGVSRTVISRVLLEEKVEKRLHTGKKTQNNRIFKNIDSHEKAYWLGFLYADGNVFFGKGNGTVSINLSRKDRQHLESFLSFIDSDGEIIDYVNKNSHFSTKCEPSEMSRVAIYSIEMARDLADKGCVPRKSLIAKKPRIAEKFYPSFALGYFDGDGSIYSVNRDGFGFSVLGTEETISFLKDEVFLLEDSRIEKTYTTNNNYYIRCGGKVKPYNCLKKIYIEPLHSICLKRKFDRFKELEKVVLYGNI